MTNEELCELAGIACGWKVRYKDTHFGKTPEWIPPKGDKRKYYPNYVEDYNAAHELLKVVEGHEANYLMLEYLLYDVLKVEDETREEMWWILTATPRQLTIAALAALKVRTIEEMMTDGE